MRHHGWPQVADERRAVIESSTETGATCTVLIIRADRSMILYLHAARETSVVLSPDVHALLVDALQRLAE